VESQCRCITHEKCSKYVGNMQDSSVCCAKIRRPSTPVDGRDFDGRCLEKPSRYRPAEKLPEPQTERVGYPSYGTRRTGVTGTACSPILVVRNRCTQHRIYFCGCCQHAVAPLSRLRLFDSSLASPAQSTCLVFSSLSL
jgi:hypothetical protein